jgi:hypothetical protein
MLRDPSFGFWCGVDQARVPPLRKPTRSLPSTTLRAGSSERAEKASACSGRNDKVHYVGATERSAVWLHGVMGRAMLDLAVNLRCGDGIA